jgi:hypothetical protein
MNTEDTQSNWQLTQDASIPAIMSGAMSGMTMSVFTLVSWGAAEYERLEPEGRDHEASHPDPSLLQ